MQKTLAAKPCSVVLLVQLSCFLQARFAKARETAKRVQCAPLRLEDKVQLVTGAASSLANYGLETCFIGESALARVRSAVVMAIWNHRRRFRSSHAVLLLFTQSHLTDPFHAQVYQCLTTLKRCLKIQQRVLFGNLGG